MSQGLIPIAYSVGVVPEIIVNNENGFIVKTVNGAIDIITSLQDNPKELKRLSLAASKTASNFRGDKMANQLRELYNNVLETHNKTKLEMPKIEKEKKKLKRIADALAIVKESESSDIN
jgi:glycogen synthase